MCYKDAQNNAQLKVTMTNSCGLFVEHPALRGDGAPSDGAPSDDPSERVSVRE